MPKLGELGGSVDILRKMRDQLVESQRKSEIEEERWNSLGEAATLIRHACESRDLEDLVTSFRKLKNRLRRPAVRKELARLEAKGEGERDGDDEKETLTKEPKGKEKEKVPAKSKEKNPTGACKCAQCGKVIDGSREPCVDDSLCTYCALKNKVIPDHKQKKKDVVVPRTDMGGDGGGQDAGGGQGESRESLRTRKYLG